MSNATPFFSAQGGGSFVWHCVSQTTGQDYSNQLASIQGLSRSAGFAGEIKVPEVTITIAGYGLFAGDGVGSELVLSLTESSSGLSADFGSYVIKNIETTGSITTIKASGRSGEVIPENFNFYSVPADNPRNWVASWLYAASGGAVNPNQLSYTDSYQRSYTRVAAGAATLKLMGVVQEPVTTIARTGTEADTSAWTGAWSTGQPDPPYIDVQRDLAPEFANKRAFLGNTPLWWHQRNQAWTVTITARMQSPATASDKGQFPLGYLQFIHLNITPTNGVLSNPSLYFSAERSIKPSDYKDVQMRFPTAAQAQSYARKKNKEAKAKDQEQSYRVEFDRGLVTVSNVAQFQGVKLPWYNSARSALAPTATNPTAPTGDCVELENVTIRSNSSAIVTFASTAGLSVNNFQFAPKSQVALWQALGITSNSALKPGYQMQQQGVHPITVNQRYFTRDLMAQAATLGSLGIFEGYSNGYGPQFCDVCPEKGNVYELPLTASTVAEVAMGTAYPMPGIISVTFTDAHDEDHTYNYTNPAGQADQSASFAIVQGHTQGWQMSTNNYLGLSSADWGENPGGLCDRWTGSYITSNHLAYNNPVSGAGAFKLLKEDGGLIDLASGAYYSISANNNYTVRDSDGNQHPLFLMAGYIQATTTVNALTQKSPFLDFYPVLQWLQANQRVFSDNLARQAFNVKTPLSFASATPGDVVAIQLDKIFSGTPALGLILGVEVSTDGYCNLEVVPMHKITSADYTNFTNLGEILP